MIYLTSDLHFNHNREFIYKARGFETIDEMNEKIIERVNSRVKSGDTLYILGDVCLGGALSGEANKELIERLNGNLIIVLGNHDTPKREQLYLTCKNVKYITYADRLDYKKYHFYLSHYPSMTGNLEKESLKQTLLNLFGHTHQHTNFYQDIPFMYHAGVDSHNCYPCLLDDIIQEMKDKVKECEETL